MLKSIFSRYQLISPSIIAMVGAGFLLNLVNAAFMLILNIYLSKNGYSDARIAEFTSYRFIGVLLFAFPAGLWLKGRSLKPLFLSSAALLPAASVIVLLAVKAKADLLISIAFFIWGIGLMFYQVAALPYIMRFRDKKSETEAISLNFANWSLATIIAGLIISLAGSLSRLSFWPEAIPVNEFTILLLIASLSLISIPIMTILKEPQPFVEPKPLLKLFSHLGDDYDWLLILKMATPTMIIAIGAGLTIPFMNLFFYNIYQIDFELFSLLGSLTAILVFLSALLIPFIRRRFGYWVAIVHTQTIGILFLALMAVTELFAETFYFAALGIALFAYLLRQPLMNMAAPVTSELVMNIVGPKNQELISALHSSIWSASWFFSAKIFQWLRQAELKYVEIFIITSLFYAAGTAMYGVIVRKYAPGRQSSSAK